MNGTLFLIILTLLFGTSGNSLAWYPRDSDAQIIAAKANTALIGSNRYYQVGEGETLIQLARAFGLGYLNLLQANPGIDPWLPAVGKQIVLPYATILPSDLKPGITINLADYKLYLVEEQGDVRTVRIYPIGIGVEDWETPLGNFQILKKAPRPTWKVPASIRQEDPTLPKFVPPGPDNPLGEYWMAFTQERHGIHGTNEPYGIGRRVSHGCIRLYPEDIKDLYRRTVVGTPVDVIYQPIKFAEQGNQIFLEVHPDYLKAGPSLDDVLEQFCRGRACGDRIKPEQLHFAVSQARGYPLLISRGPTLALKEP